MPNRPRRRSDGAPVPQRPAVPPSPPDRQEPVMRRWPHPVQPSLPQQEDPFVGYVRCALAYQNQMLADIKALLEQIQLNTAPEDPPAEEL